MKYYRLLDEKNNGKIIKVENKRQYRYDTLKGWIQTTVMLNYWSDGSDTYDMYEEISEREAFTALNISPGSDFLIS